VAKIVAKIISTIFILSAFPCVAGTVIEIDADRQFAFAEHCFSNREYDRAIDEYHRFLYFFPEDARADQAGYKIGMSYFESGRFKEAAKAFSELIEHQHSAFNSTSNRNVSSDDFFTKAYFMISECHVKTEDFGFAVSNLQHLMTLAKDQDVRDEAQYRIGWIYLEMNVYNMAREAFGKISDQNKETYRLKKLSAELENERDTDKKNPVTAGILGVIPGAGYLYCGRYHDALTAFLINGGMMYAAYESFDSGNYALGGMITLFEAGFYAGSIYGSVNSAHKYNRGKNREFINQLKESAKVSFSNSPKYGDALVLSFQYDF
jgi:tetratricopeptide (TPR) repeat protein